MGYYSDVKLSTTKEGWEKIQNYIKEQTTDKYVLDNAETKTYGAGAYVIVSFEGMKWYEEDKTYFPDVCVFMKALRILDEGKIPYQYVRTGEDDEDVERRQNGEMLDGMKSLSTNTIIEEW